MGNKAGGGSREEFGVKAENVSVTSPPRDPGFGDEGKVSAEHRLGATEWREVEDLRSLQLISLLSVNIKHMNSLGLK